MGELRTAEEAGPEKALSVKFMLEPEDMRAFIIYNRRHSPQMKRLRALYVVVVIALGIHHALSHYDRPKEQIVGFFIYVILFVAVFWAWRIASRWFMERKTFTAREQPGLFCEHTITLFEDALFEETPVNRSEHRWTGIHSIVDTQKHIFICVAANAAHVIPKRAFADTSAERAFLERAQELHHRAQRD